MTSQKNYVLIIVVAVIAFILGGALGKFQTEQSAPAVDSANIPTGGTLIPLSVVSLRENASTSPDVSLEYPQFTSLSADFNDDIASSTLGRLADFRTEVAENSAARAATSKSDPSGVIPPSAYSFDASWQAEQVNSRYVSLIVRYGSYSGGANGNQELQTFNYDVTAGREMTLADLFASSTDYLSQISKLAREQLSESLAAASPGYSPAAQLNPGTTPEAENFKNFTFNRYSVTFYFPKYQVAPGAFGEQKVTIPRSAIK